MSCTLYLQHQTQTGLASELWCGALQIEKEYVPLYKRFGLGELQTVRLSHHVCHSCAMFHAYLVLLLPVNHFKMRCMNTVKITSASFRHVSFCRFVPECLLKLMAWVLLMCSSSAMLAACCTAENNVCSGTNLSEMKSIDARMITWSVRTAMQCSISDLSCDHPSFALVDIQRPAILNLTIAACLAYIICGKQWSKFHGTPQWCCWEGSRHVCCSLWIFLPKILEYQQNLAVEA